MGVGMGVFLNLLTGRNQATGERWRSIEAVVSPPANKAATPVHAAPAVDKHPPATPEDAPTPAIVILHVFWLCGLDVLGSRDGGFELASGVFRRVRGHGESLSVPWQQRASAECASQYAE